MYVATVVFAVAARLATHLVHLTWWPISKTINACIILLLPVYNVITFILLPFIHLGQAIVTVLSIPFRVKWLEQIEVSD